MPRTTASNRSLSVAASFLNGSSRQRRAQLSQALRSDAACSMLLCAVARAYTARSAIFSRHARALLSEACGHYTYISSLNVYPDMTRPGLTEEDELDELDDMVARFVRNIRALANTTIERLIKAVTTSLYGAIKGVAAGAGVPIPALGLADD